MSREVSEVLKEEEDGKDVGDRVKVVGIRE